ncbi:MAG TPA: DUF4031 domain-containing protein [Jatrophihabitans sp.]|jgi:hypothetical protein
MTCYVDTVREYPDAGLRYSPTGYALTGGGTLTEFCHLLADTREELHAMADELGIPRRFFQDHPWRWHHDLPAHLREQAVARGAREVTMHEVGAILKARRAAYLG